MGHGGNGIVVLDNLNVTQLPDTNDSDQILDMQESSTADLKTSSLASSSTASQQTSLSSIDISTTVTTTTTTTTATSTVSAVVSSDASDKCKEDHDKGIQNNENNAFEVGLASYYISALL